MPRTVQQPDLERQLASLIMRVEQLERARPTHQNEREVTGGAGVDISVFAQEIEETPVWGSAGFTDPDTNDSNGADAGWVNFYFERYDEDERAVAQMVLGAGDTDPVGTDLVAFIDTWVSHYDLYDTAFVYTNWQAMRDANPDHGAHAMVTAETSDGAPEEASVVVEHSRSRGNSNGGVALRYKKGSYAKFDGRAASGQTEPILSLGSTGPVLFEVTTDRGVWFCPTTTTARDAMSSPALGMMIYNSTTAKFQVRVSGAWADLH